MPRRPKEKSENKKELYAKAVRISSLARNKGKVKPALSKLNKAELKEYIDNDTPLSRRSFAEALRQGSELRSRLRAGDFNAIFNRPERYTTRDARLIFNNMVNRQNRQTLIFGNQRRTIVESGRNFVIDLLRFGGVEERKEDYGSDAPEDFNMLDHGPVRVEEIIPRRVIANRNGGWYPFLNPTALNLERYGIYSTSAEREQCLIQALRVCGIGETALNNVMLSISNGANIARNQLNKIANMLGCCIVLHQVKEREGRTIEIIKIPYGDPTNNNKVNIAIHHNHYFAYEDTIYSKWSINNFDNITDKTGDWYNKGARGGVGTKMNSLRLIWYATPKWFIRGDLSKAPEASHCAETRDLEYLDNIENEQRPYKYKPVTRNKKEVFFADCESFVSTGKHTLYMIGICGTRSLTHSLTPCRAEQEVSIFNVCRYPNSVTDPQQQAVNDMLSVATSEGQHDSIVYFHNVRYDSFILSKWLKIDSICEQGSTVYSVTVRFKGRKVVFKDSYKMLSMPLCKFAENLGLDKQKAEAINYDFYTPERDGQMVLATDYAKGLCAKDKKIFETLVTTEKFDASEYYAEYLKLDCLVLRDGMNAFNKLVKELTNGEIEAYDCLTISSLSDKYNGLNGCFDGTYEITGNLRAIVGKAIRGGRVLANPAYVKEVIEGPTQDFDGVALYPSAMRRIGIEMGLTKGPAKRFDVHTSGTNSLNSWQQKHYCILKVQITKVNRKQQMPFIAHSSKDSLNYLNTPPKEPVWIDKTTLEDYIEFHQIEYDIKDGIYWDNGGNKKIKGVIETLHKNRAKAKEEDKQGLQLTIKLLMNSGYGKLAQKKHDTMTKVVQKVRNVLKNGIWTQNEPLNDYIFNNFATIKSIKDLNAQSVSVEQTTVDCDYNRAHLGCQILSMSRRIMNEVMDTADRVKVPIYYQDTDSMHMPESGINPLVEAFRNKYGRELEGEELGQFNSDFKMKGCKNVMAYKTLILGKKCYIDLIRGTDKDGNIKEDIHYRMKGVTSTGLEEEAKKTPGGMFGLFKELASGVEKKILLNPFNVEDNKKSVMFDFHKAGMSVEMKKPFYRTVKF